MIKEKVLHESRETRLTKCTSSLSNHADYFVLTSSAAETAKSERTTAVKINRNSQSVLALNSNSKLLLLNVSKSKFNVISQNAPLIDFDFLDKSNSHFALLFANGELCVISRSGKITQTIDKFAVKGSEKVKVNSVFDMLVFFSAKVIHFLFRQSESRKYAIFQSLTPLLKQDFLSFEFLPDSKFCCILQKSSDLLIFNCLTQNKVANIKLPFLLTEISFLGQNLIVLSGSTPNFCVINFEASQVSENTANDLIVFKLPLNNKNVIKSKVVNAAKPQIAFLCSDKTIYSVKIHSDIFKENSDSKALRCTNLFKFKMNPIVDFEVSSDTCLSVVILQNGETRIYEMKNILIESTVDCFNIFRVENESPIGSNDNVISEKIIQSAKNDSASIFGHMLSEKQMIDLVKMKKYIKNYYKYPDSKRVVNWKIILNISDETGVFDHLKAMGKYSDDKLIVTLKDSSTNTDFQILSDSFGHYCPFFYNNRLFLGVMYPFLRMFSDDLNFVFEVTLRFLFNWGQHLFIDFPSNSKIVRAQIEGILSYFDPDLLGRVNSFGLMSSVFSWIGCLYTNILPKESCKIVFDIWITFPEAPELFMLTAIGLLLIHRDALIAIEEKEKIEEVFATFSQTNVVELVCLMFELYEECYEKKLFSGHFEKAFRQISAFHYQKFPFLPEMFLKKEF